MPLGGMIARKAPRPWKRRRTGNPPAGNFCGIETVSSQRHLIPRPPWPDIAAQHLADPPAFKPLHACPCGCPHGTYRELESTRAGGCRYRDFPGVASRCTPHSRYLRARKKARRGPGVGPQCATNAARAPSGTHWAQFPDFVRRNGANGPAPPRAHFHCGNTGNSTQAQAFAARSAAHIRPQAASWPRRPGKPVRKSRPRRV